MGLLRRLCAGENKNESWIKYAPNVTISDMDWNHILGIVGALATIGAFIHALIIHYKKKSFSYYITDTPVISINKKLEDVAVMYKGRRAENLRVVLVTVW